MTATRSRAKKSAPDPAPPAKKKDDPGRKIQRDVAIAIGITTRQLRNLHESGIPRNTDGTYPWPEALHWYIEFKKNERKAGDAAEEKTKRDLLHRRLELEVRTAELELAERERRLVSIDYMERQTAELLQRLRAKLLNFPSKWAPAMVGLRTIAEAQTRLEPAIAEAMQSLAETGEDPELDDGADDTEDEPESED